MRRDAPTCTPTPALKSDSRRSTQCSRSRAALQPTDPGNLDTLETPTPVEGESHAQPEHYVTSLPPVKWKRKYDPRPDNDPGDPEALPQEWTFLEELQLRIR